MFEVVRDLPEAAVLGGLPTRAFDDRIEGSLRGSALALQAQQTK